MRLSSNSSALYLTVFLAATISSLFAIKHKVHNIGKEITKLNATILKEKEAIHILNAEWAFITQPSKVAKLVSKKLELEPMSSQNIKKLIIHKNSAIELTKSSDTLLNKEELT